MIQDMKEFIIKMYHKITSRDGSLFTDALSYSLIAGLAPIIILAVVLTSRYFASTDQIINLLQHYMPSDLILPFVEYLTANEVRDLIILLPLVGASMWAASQSVYSFLLISSEDEGVLVPAMILRVVALYYFLIVTVSILMLTSLVGFIPIFRRTLLSYPVVLTIFFIFFYRVLSFQFKKLKQIIPGALFSSIALTLFGRIFFVIMDRYSNYQTIYGPLASFMMALISVWIISWIIFLGYCINVSLRNPNERSVKVHWVVRRFGKFKDEVEDANS